jgi:hypothetical protein
MGSNFREYLAMINYQWKRFYAAYKFNFTQAGNDFTGDFLNIGNYGGNILKAYDNAANKGDVTMLNGTAYKILNNEIRVGYIINPKINFVAEFAVQFRSYTGVDDNFIDMKSHSLGFSLKTNIFNRYYDLPMVY